MKDLQPQTIELYSKQLRTPMFNQYQDIVRQLDKNQGFDDFYQNNFLPCAEVGLYKPVIRTGVSTNCLKQFTIIPVKGRSIMFWRFFYCP